MLLWQSRKLFHVELYEFTWCGRASRPGSCCLGRFHKKKRDVFGAWNNFSLVLYSKRVGKFHRITLSPTQHFWTEIQVTKMTFGWGNIKTFASWPNLKHVFSPCKSNLFFGQTIPCQLTSLFRLVGWMRVPGAGFLLLPSVCLSLSHWPSVFAFFVYCTRLNWRLFLWKNPWQNLLIFLQQSKQTRRKR